MMRTEVMFQGRHSVSSASLNSQVVGVSLVTHQVRSSCSKYRTICKSAVLSCFPPGDGGLGTVQFPCTKAPRCWACWCKAWRCSSRSFQSSLTLRELCRVLSGSRAQVCKGFEEHLDKHLQGQARHGQQRCLQGWGDWEIYRLI